MLALDGLTRRFGATVALDGLSFEVPAGTMYGFVGRNGAGKTTAMRIVLGVLAPDAGTASWQGREIDRAARARFGYMPEERGLYPKMRVAEQVDYFASLHDVADPPTAALLERLGVADRANDKVEDLSLGNQQRVQLAVALVHEPELLVLDEPFSGLDPLGVDVLADVLRERVAAGATVLFSSHQLELVERLCDAIAIVEGGRLVAAGTVDALRGAGERYELVAGGERRLMPAAEAQAALRAAPAPVERFGPYEPPLAELFRDAVRP